MATLFCIALVLLPSSQTTILMVMMTMTMVDFWLPQLLYIASDVDCICWCCYGYNFSASHSNKKKKKSWEVKLYCTTVYGTHRAAAGKK